jgi:hypothetical protein
MLAVLNCILCYLVLSAMVDAVDELTSWYLNAIYRLFGPCRAMYLWMI